MKENAQASKRQYLVSKPSPLDRPSDILLLNRDAYISQPLADILVCHWFGLVVICVFVCEY